MCFVLSHKNKKMVNLKWCLRLTKTILVSPRWRLRAPVHETRKKETSYVARGFQFIKIETTVGEAYSFRQTSKSTIGARLTITPLSEPIQLLLSLLLIFMIKTKGNESGVWKMEKRVMTPDDLLCLSALALQHIVSTPCFSFSEECRNHGHH